MNIARQRQQYSTIPLSSAQKVRIYQILIPISGNTPEGWKRGYERCQMQQQCSVHEQIMFIVLFMNR